MQNKKENKFYLVKKKIKECSGVTTLKLVAAKGKSFDFIPGQFVAIHFCDNRCGGKGKFYSISSCPGEKTLDISVKKAGEFSNALHSLKTGERILLDKPTGFFYPDSSADKIVFLAGGIGITPFFSIIKNYFQNKTDKEITLFYGVKEKADAAFAGEFKKISQKFKNFKLIYAFSKEDKKILKSEDNCECGRIDIRMLKKHLRSFKGRHFFICGPIGFVDCLWRELKKNGVKEDHIKVESFF